MLRKRSHFISICFNFMCINDASIVMNYFLICWHTSREIANNSNASNTPCLPLSLSLALWINGDCTLIDLIIECNFVVLQNECRAWSVRTKSSVRSGIISVPSSCALPTEFDSTYRYFIIIYTVDCLFLILLRTFFKFLPFCFLQVARYFQANKRHSVINDQELANH